MDIYNCIFIYFNILNDELTGAEYQLDSAYIRSYLHKHGLETLQYINRDSLSYHDFIDDFVKLPAEYFIFYVNEYNYFINKIVINNLKRKSETIKICIIGPSAKYIADSLADDILFDVCITKDYHIVLEDWLIKNKDISAVSNINYRLDGILFRNEECDYVYTLDDIGLPYSEGMIPPEEVFHVGMITSTGCCGSCSFCSYNDRKSIFRLHSIDNVIKELDFVSQFIGGENRDIYFFDDCFSVDTKRTLALLEKMSEKKYTFTFWCCTRADILTDELLDLMVKCNFNRIIIGLETASLSVMDKLGKVKGKDTSEKYINKVLAMYQLAKQRNLDAGISVNFGLPYEKLEDAEQTIQFIIRNDMSKNVSICFMTCFPGSRVFEDSDDFQVLKQVSPVRLPFFTQYTSYNMGEVFDKLYHSGIISGNIDSIYDNLYQLFSMEFTGLYNDRKISSTIDTVIVEEIDDDIIDFIDKIVNMNGNIIIFSEHITIKKNLCCNDRKRLKYNIVEYEKNQELAYVQDKYLPNQSFVRKTNDHIFIQHNNWYLKKNLSLFMTELDIEKNLMYFEHYLEQFKRNNLLEVSAITHLNIYNSCCFAGNCELHHLRKLYVKGENIYAGCDINCKVCFGNIKNSYDDLLSAGIKIRNEFITEQGCADCEVEEWCPKCVLSGRILGDSSVSYCSTIRKNRELLIFLKLLAKLHKVFNLNRISEIRIMKAYFADLHQITISSPFDIHGVCVVEIDDKVFITNLLADIFLECNAYAQKSLVKDDNIIKFDTVNFDMAYWIKKGIVDISM